MIGFGVVSIEQPQEGIQSHDPAKAIPQHSQECWGAVRYVLLRWQLRWRAHRNRTPVHRATENAALTAAKDAYEHLDFSYQTTDLFDGDLPYEKGLNPTLNNPGIVVSVPERALLELVSDAGKSMPHDELTGFMEMAGELRESVLHQFLSHCTRVKVIKLVRDLAQHAGQPWVSIAQRHVDRLGADKRWSYVSKNGERLTLK